MEIVNVRIDERLIHGQVATAWINYLQADRVMVIDEEVIKNKLQKQLLKLACPDSCKLSILGVNTASKNLNSEKYGDEKIFIIVKSPQTLVDLYKAGFKVNKVTVGNMSGKNNTKVLKKSVSVSDLDIENFKFLNDEGVRIYAQMVPKEVEENFMKLIEG